MESLNSWFSVCRANYDQKCQETRKYGEYRFKLGHYCAKILDQLSVTWWLDAGSLLGAYRDGRMIAHDNDFDLAVLCTEQEFKKLQQQLREKIDHNFKVRKIDTYAHKIQVYDPHQGQYLLDQIHKINFHNVTVNIQLYKRQQNDAVTIAFFKDDFFDFISLTVDMILPLCKIKYCGHQFNCPNKLQKYLEEYYNYIGLGAQYNKVTRKYRQNRSIPKNISNKADEGNHEELKNQ